MANELEGKNIVVFGANGQVGRPLVRRLIKEGATVIAVLKRAPQLLPFLGWLDREFPGQPTNVRTIPCDLAHTITDSILIKVQNSLEALNQSEVHGMVYSVNHYPEGGVTEAVRFPLTDRCVAELRQELQMHVEGFHAAILGILPLLAESAAVAVISSAVTEIPDEQCPPFLHAGLYAAAKAGQDELVKWWRRDPTIREKGIRLQLLKPSAINTPSHDGPFGAPKNKRIPMPAFLDEVLAALASQEIITKVIRVQGG